MLAKGMLAAFITSEKNKFGITCMKYNKNRSDRKDKI